MMQGFLSTVSSRHRWWLLVAGLALYLLAVNDHWAVERDAAFYLSLGRSLAQGEGMAFNGQQHWGVPPLLPMLVAACRLIVGEHYWLVNLLITSMAVGTALLAWRLARLLCEDLDDPLRRLLPVGVLVVVGCSSRLFIESTRIMTDVPFAFLVTLGLYAFARGLRDNWWWHGVAALALVAATMSRLPGVIFAAGTTVAALCAARRARGPRLYGALAAGAAVAMALVLWLVLVRSHQDTGTIDYIRPAARALVADLSSWNKLAEIGDALARFPTALCGAMLGHKMSAWAFSLVPTVPFLIGLVEMVRRRQWGVLMPYAAYLAFLIVYTPGAVGPRYFMPAIPFLAYGFLLGVARLGALPNLLNRRERQGLVKPPRRRVIVSLYIVLVVVVAADMPRTLRQIGWMRSRDFYAAYEGGDWLPYIQCGRYLQEHGRPAEDQVIGPDITLLLYVSQLRSPSGSYNAHHLDENAPDDLVRIVQAQGCRYLVIPDDRPVWSRDVTAAVRATGDFQDEPKRFGNLLLFERSRPGVPPSAGSRLPQATRCAARTPGNEP